MSGRGLILGIESSCDETAAAVVERGSRTLSSVVASQIATHARYGGVVPELASREHLRAIVPVVRAALAEAGITLADLDAVAVTAGPGLAGALLVGITYAKALAFAQGLPLIAVNHLEGHIHAVLLHERSLPDGQPSAGTNRESESLQGTGFSPIIQPQESESMKGTSFSPYIQSPIEGRALAPEKNSFKADEPALALVVSGGHTHLYLCRPAHGAWSYSLVGRTLDDAAGEAYDKVAKLLGFGYPGGPWIDALARFGNPRAVPFAFSQIKPKVHLGGKPPRTKAALTAPIADLDPRFLFSFSGIKTAVLRYVELHELRGEALARAARLFPPEAAALKGLGFSRAIGDVQTGRALAPEGNLNAEGDGGFNLRVKPIETTMALATEGSTSPISFEIPSFSAASLVPDKSSSANPTPPHTKEEALALCPQQVLDLAASFQCAVVGDLMKKTFAAAESLGAQRILITGGVAANRELRARFSAEAARRGLRVAFPTLALSTDNAAMIAAAAWPRFQAGEFAEDSLSADPSLALGR
jgi:N6-L-threonylcarbamoyladenine synthase